METKKIKELNLSQKQILEKDKAWEKFVLKQQKIQKQMDDHQKQQSEQWEYMHQKLKEKFDRKQEFKQKQYKDMVKKYRDYQKKSVNEE